MINVSIQSYVSNQYITLYHIDIMHISISSGNFSRKGILSWVGEFRA